MFEIYRGKTVLITGHTGVKASWLALWLKMLGAKVIGIGNPPKPGPTHYAFLKNQPLEVFDEDFTLNLIKDQNRLSLVMDDVDVVFHLAAKAIVAQTFDEPAATFENNIMSVVNLLDACREQPTVTGIVCVTSDKVYESKEWNYAYRETDALGADDPYSTSKVCIEHIVECYRSAYGMNIASARAGNILCGGDWGAKRLFPDIVTAAAAGKPVEIHTPDATRPFQHVLDALQGYLLLGEKMLQGKDVNRAWNFGPVKGELSVLRVLEVAHSVWPAVQWVVDNEPTHKFMVYLLKLDSSESIKQLGWKPVWSMEEAVVASVQWYKNYYEDGTASSQASILMYDLSAGFYHEYM